MVKNNTLCARDFSSNPNNLIFYLQTISRLGWKYIYMWWMCEHMCVEYCAWCVSYVCMWINNVLLYLGVHLIICHLKPVMDIRWPTQICCGLTFVDSSTRMAFSVYLLTCGIWVRDSRTTAGCWFWVGRPNLFFLLVSSFGQVEFGVDHQTFGLILYTSPSLVC